MKKDKKSLMKFSLLPLALLLLIFTTGEQSFLNLPVNPGSIVNINQIQPLDTSLPCQTLMYNKTYSTNRDRQEYLMGGESQLIYITVPTGSNIYIILDWNFNFCGAKVICDWEASIRLYNAINEPLNAHFYAPYEDRATIALNPGSWTLNITNLDDCYMCYSITLEIHGCYSPGSSGVVETKLGGGP